MPGKHKGRINRISAPVKRIRALVVVEDKGFRSRRYRPVTAAKMLRMRKVKES